MVDDNVDAADTLVALLATNGFVACAIYDGSEAVLLAELMKPTLVFLDIDMPGMDGYDTAACILRGAPADGHPRLVALTGRSSAGDRTLSTSAGFDLHVRKPIGCEQLFDLAAAAYDGPEQPH
ncbi:response regulator [Mitsuaria sp. 7]|uniref:response regulator n=1 Tax=Mitsuaria sp. 7 TaxID=1658665 RepID=UPI0018D470A5|nr:response regulator [Mitsuaria sp. 7]